MAASIEVSDEFNQSTYLLDRHVEEGRGDRTAIIYQSNHITYNEVLKNANKAGNTLLELGVERENRVLLCLPDSPELLYMYFGAMKLAAVPVPVSTMALPQDYSYFLNDSRAKVLVTTQERLSQIIPVKDELKFLRHIILVDGEDPIAWKWEDLMSSASSSLQTAVTSKDDMAFWLYSSGTTGKPKGVVHMHHDLLHYIPPYCQEVISASEEDVVFSASKMYFSYGRNNSIELPFFSGAAVILEPELPKPEKLVEVISRDKPTLFFCVPAAYTGLINLLKNSNTEYDFSSLRLCISAGEALPKTIFEEWKEMIGLEILDGVGSTDVGGIYLSNFPDNKKVGSSGFLLPGFEGKLIDDEGEEAAVGEAGTLWIKNDGTTPFYWNKHDKSKENIHGEWFNTGDRFYRDEDDFYWYVGRANDMIKASGIWVSPLEVEEILREHPAVMDCAVVSARDNANLEKPLAYVVLDKGYESSAELEKELQEHVRSRTAHYKYPRWIKFIQELPRTASGKIQRFKLRQ